MLLPLPRCGWLGRACPPERQLATLPAILSTQTGTLPVPTLLYPWLGSVFILYPLPSDVARSLLGIQRRADKEISKKSARPLSLSLSRHISTYLAPGTRLPSERGCVTATSHLLQPYQKKKGCCPLRSVRDYFRGPFKSTHLPRMATHHARHPSHHSKKPVPAHARPSKPAPLSKRSLSYNKSSHKAAHSRDLEVANDEEDSMAVSFLNYCTVCEKQIIVPSNTVLYCSESCRKTDAEKSLTYSCDYYSPPMTPFGTYSFEDLTFRDIVPQRSPTQSDSKRSSMAFSDISSDDNLHSDNEKSLRSNSEASRYLRKFQSINHTSETVRPCRPRYNRASASQISFPVAPSLSHTPTSSVSYSLPYTPANFRPLPPRTNPHNSSYGAKSIDLVTPLTAPSSPKQYTHKTPPIMKTSTSTIEGEIVYAKSPVPSPSTASGSLGQLLNSTPR